MTQFLTQDQARSQIEQRIRVALTGVVSNTQITLNAWMHENTNDWSWDTNEGGSVERHLEDVELGADVFSPMAGPAQTSFSMVITL
jgi:hypothetical protein